MARTTETSIFRYHGHHRLFSFNPTLSVSLSFSRPLFSLSLSLSSVSSSSAALCCRPPRVSTATVEYESQEGEFDFEGEIARLRRSAIGDWECEERGGEACGGGRGFEGERFFCSGKSGVSRVLGSVSCDSYELFLVKCLVAAGQEHMIEKWEVSGAEGLGKKNGVADEEIGALKKLLKTLRETEQFYDCIGGIIGYQIVVLELLTQSLSKKHINWIQHINEAMQCQLLELHSPCGLDLSKNTAYASQAALWGVEGLPELGEIYPLGGSADRLGLVDPDTGECLPAAMLPYCGRTLLEGLIRDFREFLYFKIYGKQCITPVAIMTSAAKNNHEHITSLCERHQWFGRAVSAEDGEWLVTKPFTPVCKPGGHGVIWKLAYDKGIFQWFYDHGRKGATVRPSQKMGFASCKRNLGATEGINVLIEKNLDGKWEYGLSCIEYTEFDKFGITDGPLLLIDSLLEKQFEFVILFAYKPTLGGEEYT
ncbi:UTP--glucose-1-phosphate uridylyltransferase 3, chloroplastic [Vitis vinifera]|uniref:UTP--glucose-1-phosphate uridylyltransferase 3, chloroplastic n=1 Tax=Vitis vinifera TaxID=29760 RepID=A0A438E3M2_VITVI|nr:UTP--glucose-1-phosphate uridylyltransferase 3, chloroplastic [Vitis vinifera]